MPGQQLPPDAPTIRLCHLVKWTDFDGYGFNLHTDKAKNIQTLGDIDRGSPAEAAGLMKGDRIIEVNGENVFNENHRQVVERIKSIPNETRLLVVDAVSDQWYREHKLVVKGTLASVKELTSSRDSQNRMTNGSSKPSAEASDAPPARLCCLRKWTDFDGYGFNLHADKQKGIQYIGIVDPGSPAETAGLRENDKIIEVNGENVEKLSHREIVEKIKSIPTETSLLVVDEGTAKWYKNKGVKIDSKMNSVAKLDTPALNPATTMGKVNGDSNTMPALPSTPPPPPMDQIVPRSDPNMVPRYCHLRKWADYEGYGFNLHADRVNNMHYIGEVDEGSPAKLGGLLPGDRLIEVNGTNIDDIAHREIIEKIKSNADKTDLLVVCKETDKTYQEKGIVPTGDMPDVVHKYTPNRDVNATETIDNDTSSKSSTPKMMPSTPSSNRSTDMTTSPQPPATPSTTADEYDVNGVSLKINSPSPAMNHEPPAYTDASANGRNSATSSSPSELDAPHSETGPQMVPKTNGDLNPSSPLTDTGSPRSDLGGDVSPIFTMKASDVREMLKQRKKKDPRVQNMDLMQKFKIMEQL